MAYFYLKALHIIFVVTWFSGMFYLVRLFIYNREAQDKPKEEAAILQQQFAIMIRRLWFGITWPSAILTLIFGMWLLISYYWQNMPKWLWIKVLFLIGLYFYHFSLHKIYSQQNKGIFRYSSQQLRLWNEVATIFLIAIVFLVVVKDGLSWLYGLVGLLIITLLLLLAIHLYKKVRKS